MKLNLRDFFWLILVAAVITLWWIDHAKQADRIRALELPGDPFASSRAQPARTFNPPFDAAVDPFGAPVPVAPAAAPSRIPPIDPFQ